MVIQPSEKCEHGESARHVIESPNAAVTGATALICPGKVYPAELVDRIKAVCHRLQITRDHDLLAHAILDAISD